MICEMCDYESNDKNEFIIHEDYESICITCYENLDIEDFFSRLV
jgi:hypothetical protein